MSTTAVSTQSRPGSWGLDQACGQAGAATPSLRQRLARLRTLHQDRVVPELILILEQVPLAELSLPDRLRLLCRLEHAVVRVSAVLAHNRARSPSPFPGQPTSLSLEQRLYAAMVRASTHLLRELDHGQGFFSEQHVRGRTWAIRVALRFFSRGVLYAVATGRPWPPGAWQSLHDLFVYLVMRGTVHIHGSSRAAEDDEPDPELVYKRLIMIGLASECCARQRLDARVLARLRTLAAESRLVAADGLIGEFGLILVDVGRDVPAEIRVGSLDDPFRGWVLRAPDAFRTLLHSLGRDRHGIQVSTRQRPTR